MLDVNLSEVGQNIVNGERVMGVEVGQKQPHFNSRSVTGTTLINVCIFSPPLSAHLLYARFQLHKLQQS